MIDSLRLVAIVALVIATHCSAADTVTQGPISGRLLQPGEPDVVLPDLGSLPQAPDASAAGATRAP